jgi:uncharacterized membrane protein
MITGSIVTLLVKMIPYMIVMKVVGGVVDLSVHYSKLKISKRVESKY